MLVGTGWLSPLTDPSVCWSDPRYHVWPCPISPSGQNGRTQPVGRSCVVTISHWEHTTSLFHMRTVGMLPWRQQIPDFLHLLEGEGVIWSAKQLLEYNWFPDGELVLIRSCRHGKPILFFRLKFFLLVAEQGQARLPAIGDESLFLVMQGDCKPKDCVCLPVTHLICKPLFDCRVR